jgi:hypothetical protein
MTTTDEQVTELVISLDIKNTYEDGDTVRTTVTDARVPAPDDLDEESDAYYAWSQDVICDFTGTGRVEGDAFYDVVVTACSEPALVGRKFAFGY